MHSPVLLAGGLQLLWGLFEASLLAGWQQGLGPWQMAGSAAAAVEPVMVPAGEVAAAAAAAAVAAAAEVPAAPVVGVLPPPKAAVWMVVAVTAVVLELSVDWELFVAAPGVLALAAGQRAQSGPAGSPSCCQGHDGMLMGCVVAGNTLQSWGMQVAPSSAWLGQGWVEGEVGPHDDPCPDRVTWQHAVPAPHQRGGLSAARAHCGAGVP